MEFMQSKLWTVVHESNHGSSISTVISKEMPEQADLVKALDIDFEEDREEYINIYEVDMDNVVNMDNQGIEVVENRHGIRIIPKVKVYDDDFIKGAKTPKLEPLSMEDLAVISDLMASYKIAMDYEENIDTFTMLGYNEDVIQFYYERCGKKGYMHLGREHIKIEEEDLLDILEL